MVFWCQGSNGVKSGASCILSERVACWVVYWATGQG